MEIICMEKQTFDELVVRLSMIEKKVTGICSQTKDAGLKKWMDCCLSPGSRTSSSTNRKMYKACWNQVITHKKESHELRSYKQKRPAD